MNPGGVGALSAQEFRVALNAAQATCGQKQLARQLGMSNDALRQTLKRVYRKLGIRSRLELPAAFAGVAG